MILQWLSSCALAGTMNVSNVTQGFNTDGSGQLSNVGFDFQTSDEGYVTVAYAAPSSHCSNVAIHFST
ncbi:MAG: hypothetical protein ACREF9_17675, partial [Opitutaceae bacterium]